MGKSLSILAITTQVYYINGWSIWPPHLALGDDVELPITMEHLRPYLRKRKGPFIAPPGLRHNQRYYPKSLQSRHLLMKREKSVPSESTILPSDTRKVRFNEKVQKIFYEPTLSIDEINQIIRQSYHQQKPIINYPDFINILMQYLDERKEEQMMELKKMYQSLKFDPKYFTFLHNLGRNLRNKEQHRAISANDAQVVRDILKEIISVQRENTPNKSDKDKLMITMESLSMKIITNHQDKRWIYRMLYQELLSDAEKLQLIPNSEQLKQFENGHGDVTKFPESGIIIFLTDKYYHEMNNKNRCQALANFYQHSEQFMNKRIYPYLKTVKGRFVEICFLDQIFRHCIAETDIKDGERELVVTIKQVMVDMNIMTNKFTPEDKWAILFWNSDLWRYAIEWKLIQDDAELQKWIQNRDMPRGITLQDCIWYIEYMGQQIAKYPFLETKDGFLTQMSYLGQVFEKFANSLQSQPWKIYQRMHFVKVQYKEWMFDPEVITFINNMYRVGMHHALNVLTSGDVRNGDNDANLWDEEKLLITLESLTRDMIDNEGADDLWKYRYLYNLIYTHAVEEELIPDDEQRQDPQVVNSKKYRLAKKYDIIIFTDDNIRCDGITMSEKNVAKNSMMAQKQKYPFLQIIEGIQSRMFVIDGTKDFITYMNEMTDLIGDNIKSKTKYLVKVLKALEENNDFKKLQDRIHEGKTIQSEKQALRTVQEILIEWYKAAMETGEDWTNYINKEVIPKDLDKQIMKSVYRTSIRSRVAANIKKRWNAETEKKVIEYFWPSQQGNAST